MDAFLALASPVAAGYAGYAGYPALAIAFGVAGFIFFVRTLWSAAREP